MNSKSGRYHVKVFFPKDFPELFREYYDTVYMHPLTFSLHSVIKLSNYITEYGKQFLTGISKVITSGALVAESVFEFYTDKEGLIEKTCIRYSLADIPVDVILVISRSSVIVTCYTISKDDTRDQLDKRLYVKKEKK